jgi:hypothetical protein
MNSVDPEILWNSLSTLYFLDSWVSQQSKERIITGAGCYTGLRQPGKSYLTVWTGEINWRTLENPYVTASIEAPLKSAGGVSKFVIFNTCPIFFWNFLVALCRFGGPFPPWFPPCLIGGFHNTSTYIVGEFIRAPWIFILKRRKSCPS